VLIKEFATSSEHLGPMTSIRTSLLRLLSLWSEMNDYEEIGFLIMVLRNGDGRGRNAAGTFAI
jgi:hypothetical protein